MDLIHSAALEPWIVAGDLRLGLREALTRSTARAIVSSDWKRNLGQSARLDLLSPLARGRNGRAPVAAATPRVVVVEYTVPLLCRVDLVRGAVAAVNAIDEEISVPQGVRRREGAAVSAAEAEQAKKIADEATWPAWTLGA